MKRFISAAVIAASLALTVGCGGDSDDPVLTQAAANPSLGLFRNATVNFYRNDNATLLGTAIGEDGTVAGPLTGYVGPVVIEIVGDDVDAEYYDESAGVFVSFPAGSEMHAIAPIGLGQIAVTPLTEIAYQGAVANGLFPISASAVRELNAEVRDVFVPFINSILSAPTLFDNNTTTGSLLDTNAGRYALFLAALAELGSGGGAPALDVLEALIEDLADGTIDGENDGDALDPAAPYDAADFDDDVLAAMATFATNFGDAALQASAAGFTTGTTVDFSGISNPPTSGGGSAGCGSECLAFFAEKADTYDGVPNEEVENGALATEFSAASYSVVIASDGNITVSGENTDFTFSANEITMFESSTETNVLYTDVQSGYNVILQEDGDAFFMNISEPFVQGGGLDLDNATLDLSTGEEGGGSEVTNLGLIQALAGTYNVTTAVTGGTGTHTRGTVIIAANGDIDFDTSVSFTASTDYETIYDKLSLPEDPDIDFGPAYFVAMVFPVQAGDGDRLDIFFSDDTATTITAFKYAPVEGTTVIVGIDDPA